MKKGTYIALGCITGASLLGFLGMYIAYTNLKDTSRVFYETLFSFTPHDIMRLFFVIFALGFIVTVILLLLDLVRYIDNRKSINGKDNKN